MASKSPTEERALIEAKDARRKYGVRVQFQVQSLAHIGDTDKAAFDLPTGSIATIAPVRKLSWESGAKLQLTVEGFPTAEDAERAGVSAAQALLLTAISCNFGLRLNYHTHRPGTVFDRLASEGATMWGEGEVAWPSKIVYDELLKGFSEPLLGRHLLLSMELFAASQLELNDRARFVMIVSSLEPLASQNSLPTPVVDFVDQATSLLDKSAGIELHLRQSLRGRLQQLRQESIRQSLNRACSEWFPNDARAREAIDHAYALRSDLLHKGVPSDLDIQFHDECNRLSPYVRSIYASASKRSFRAPSAV